MKKIFSLLLTVALLLSAVAFPAAVSAEGEDITVSLAFDKTTVYPGDVVNVSLVAKSNGETGVTSATTNVYFTYDATKLTIGELDEGFSVEDGIVSYVTESETTVAAGEGTVIGTIPFTAVASGDAKFDLAEKSSAFVDAELNKFTVAYTDPTLTITACSATGKIKTGTDTYENLVSGTTTTYRNSSQITIKAEVVGDADTITLTKAAVGDGEPVVYTLNKNEDFNITEDGTYTLSILLKGQTEKIEYTFIYSKIIVKATLSVTAPTGSDAGYTINDKFTIPVTIDGLGDGVEASMVKFSVAYDDTKLKLSTLDDTIYAVDGNTIVYNKDVTDTENALIDGEPVANLEFTVVEGATNGTTKVSIDALELALVTDVVDATNPSIDEDTAEVAVTVIPDGKFVTTSDNVEKYAKSYDVAISNNSSASVKVYHSATKIETVDAATLYADTNATAVTDSFTADKEGYYYVLSLIGDGPKVYDYVEIESKVDVTIPELTIPADASEWTSSVNTAIELAVSATDAKSGVASIMYSTTSAEANDFTAVEGDKITFVAGTTVKTIWIYAQDAVGNKTETKEISVLKDGTAPVLNAIVNGETIEITATDAETNIESVTVNDTPVELDEEGKATYTATTAGTNKYTVVATNGVDATTTVEVDVTVATPEAPSIKVAIRKSTADDVVETTKDGFVPNGVTEDGEPITVDNGRFTYVKLERYQATDNDGFTTTYTLTKGGVNVEGFGDLAAAYEIDATTNADVAGEYVLTVTNTKDGGASDTAVYNFTVVANQKDMYSVDADAIFNAYDLAVLRKHVAGDAAAASKFTNRLSADVTADLKLDINDAKEVLRAMQDVEYSGIYNFAIMNKIIDADASLK